jgi:hypothetical protein
VADHRYFAGLLALGNEAYDPMLQRREHSAHVNNGNMNVALTVNRYVRRAHSDLCSGSEFAPVLLTSVLVPQGPMLMTRR